MEKYELIFIPGPGMGHLASTVEMANLLLNRDPRLSVTLFPINLPFDTKTSDFIHSVSSSNNSIRFITLPNQPPPLPETPKTLTLKTVVESYKSSLRDAVANHRRSSDSPRLAGFVIDMFCTTMIDIAQELEVPCYLFFTSTAALLSLTLHLQHLHDLHNNNDAVHQLLNSNAELTVPGFVNPIPGKVIPWVFFDELCAAWFYDMARRFRADIKGILINTFAELESQVMNQIPQVPPLYAVGPVLNLKGTGSAGEDIQNWLDEQPPLSVVFLCFGSMGSFEDDQVKEIARALERSGVRFLWSLRRPPPPGTFAEPNDYVNTKDVVSEGFLDRTAGIGKVIGWAPQVEILAHPAIGGFVSHCGWNSTLESLWHGVPVATWPMYAEQQMNAFMMVVEMGLAVEITLDYRKDVSTEKAKMVSAEEIERGIRKLMEESDEMRKKVKEKSEESRKCVAEGGSSFISLGHFIEDVIANSP